MEFWNKFVLVFLCICIISGVIFLPLHYLNNKVDYANKKIDEATLYDTLKQVEDTCRAMIASYQSDFLIWAQNVPADIDEKLDYIQ